MVVAKTVTCNWWRCEIEHEFTKFSDSAGRIVSICEERFKQLKSVEVA